MSDEDLIRRGDAILSVKCALNRGVMEQRLRSLPAVPPAAERLARAADAWDREVNELASDDEAWARSHAASAEFREALRAYRAAKPPVSDGKTDSTGAAPPAVPMRLALDVCRDLAGLLRSEPFPKYDVRWAMLQRRAEEACRAAPPDSTEAAPPAAEPAKPEPVIRACVKCRDMIGVSATRCGKCGAEQPAKEPAPCVGTNCANPRCNYMVPCGSICNKCGSIAAKAACSACRPGGAA